MTTGTLYRPTIRDFTPYPSSTLETPPKNATIIEETDLKRAFTVLLIKEVDTQKLQKAAIIIESAYKRLDEVTQVNITARGDLLELAIFYTGNIGLEIISKLTNIEVILEDTFPEFLFDAHYYGSEYAQC